MKWNSNNYITLRSIIIGCIFSLCLGVIGAKAVYVQVYRGEWLAQKAASQYEKSHRFHGKRGTIYDKNLREMAVSIDVASVVAYPPQISDPRSASLVLAQALDNKDDSIYKKLSSKRSFEWVKRKVTPKETERVRDLNINGIDFFMEHSRFYPNKTLAAQVIGFSGIDGHGLEGIEYRYDAQLSGSTYLYTVLKDALGRGFKAEKGISPSYYHSGNNLVLTIDRTIQFIVENSLEEAVTRFMATSGIAMVMSPKTGAVLALAHFPFFNPNSFERFDKQTWRNRAITDPFEPGSTMKIFTVSAAVESGAIGPHSIFFCENGRYAIGRHVVRDTRPHGWLTLQQILQFSSNIGAVKVSETLGAETLYHSLSRFGFGKKTDIDCPGETAGTLTSFDHWSKIDLGAIAFGQGISVSAIQLLTAVSAIANNGILMKPFIVQAVTNQNGRLIEGFGPKEVRRVLSVKTAATVRKMMRTVVLEGGTGMNAALEGYSVCGKTGTAQKTAGGKTYEKEKYLSSFVGFAPEENAAIAVLVIVDEPKKHHHGGIVAAPAFKKILGDTLNYLNIPPLQDPDTLTAGLESEVNG